MRRGERFYRRLVRLGLPASSRKDAERELMEVFAGMRERARRRGGVSVAGFWLRAMVDLGWTILAERARGGGAMMRAIGRGWSSALRSVIRRPRERLVEAVTLGLGVGAATLVAVLARDVLLEPLPYDDPGSLVRLVEVDEDGRSWWPSRLNFQEWRAAAGFTRGMAAASIPVPRPVLVGEEAVRARVATASGGFFDLLGAELVAGRGPADDEQRPGAPPVALVSEAFWRSTLSSATPGSAELLIGTEHWTVIGVLEEEFGFLGDGGVWQQPDIWLPMERDPEAGHRQSHGIHVVARLAPGTPLERADAEFDRMAASVATAAAEPTHAHSVATTRLTDDLLGPSRRPLRFLFFAAGAVLLVAALNLASTRLVHGLGRQRELAVRRALGADRGQVVAQLMVEAVVVALPAALAGVVMARVTLDAARVLDPAALPRLAGASVGPTTGLVALALAVGVALLASALPAAFLSGESLTRHTRSAGGGIARRLRLTWDAVLAVQVGLTLTLLVGSGLMIRGLVGTLAEELGYEPDRVLAAQVSLPETSYAEGLERAAWIGEALERVRGIPGIEAATVTDILPHLTTARIAGTWAPERDEERIAWSGLRLVDESFFDVLRIPRLQGSPLPRSLDEGVLVDRTVVDALLDGGDVVGAMVQSGMTGAPVRVAGVVGPVREWSYEFGRIGTIYMRYHLHPQIPSDLFLLLRPRPGASVEAQTVIAAVAEVDPQVPVELRGLPSHLAGTLGSRRLLLATTALFAVLGLVLATVGIYGVVAYLARRRLRETGIRVALGARPAAVGRATLVTGLRPALAGALVGAALSVGLGRALASLVVDAPTFDAVVLMAAAGVVVLAGAAAGWLPAWRATRVDPAVVLRDE